MTIRSDPENNEIQAVLGLVDFTGKDVLEIGCGDGRLTGRYANAAAHVVAIDPFEEAIRRAKPNFSSTLRDRVKFHCIDMEGFASDSESDLFDVAILSWSL